MQQGTPAAGLTRKPLQKKQKIILACVAVICGALGFFVMPILLPNKGPEYREGYHYGKLEAQRTGSLLEKDFNVKGRSEKWQKGFWDGYHKDEE